MNDSAENEAQKEFAAIQQLHEALEPLAPEARSRVIAYISSLLDIDIGKATKAQREERPGEDDGISDGNEEPGGETSFGSFAELYDGAGPGTDAERALVAGYWLQELQGNDHFTAQDANKELKHLGHRISNITSSLTSLKSAKPALVLQLRKGGKSQQARKQYKVTDAGLKRVREMISG